MTMSELKWRIRRSTLELDILLHRFLDQSYHQLSSAEKSLFQSWVLLEDHEWQDLLKTKHPLIEKICHCQME